MPERSTADEIEGLERAARKEIAQLVAEIDERVVRPLLLRLIERVQATTKSK